MRFKADEIVSVLQKEIEQYRTQLDTREVGRVLEVGDGIARVYGLSGVMAGEMVEFTRTGVRGLAFNLEENSVGVIILGELPRDRGRRRGPHHRRTAARAGRRRPASAGSSIRSAIRSTARGRSSRTAVAAGRIDRSRRGRPAAGQSAAADRHQGHRLHDARRPRPARADHRRPQDRQDRHRHRHHHQSARSKTSSASTSPSAKRNRPWPSVVETLRAERGHGLHHRRGRLGRGGRPAAIHRPLRRLRHGRVSTCTSRAATPCASTTT